jgi:hypothetical protein
MAHVLTRLSMQRLGVPKGPVASLFGVLLRSIHCIQTAYGDSEVQFTSTPDDPIQGIGQANSCGPAGWVALSGPIMEMHGHSDMVSGLSQRLVAAYSMLWGLPLWTTHIFSIQARTYTVQASQYTKKCSRELTGGNVVLRPLVVCWFWKRVTGV